VPEKPHHVRIKADLWEPLGTLAKKERMGIAGLIDRIIAEYIEAQGEPS
jgi:hypothetical protein